MTIKWIGCSPSNYTVGRGGKSVDKIVVHWMAGTLASCDATFQDGRRQASAHYGIGNEIHQYVKEEDTAWHAGVWEVNQNSIGIEHEGGPDIPITEQVYRQTVELITDICKRYNLTTSAIHKHNEYKATQCPGTLDVDRIIREVNLALQPAQISDDEKRALDYLTLNRAEGNLEGTVRAWHDSYLARPGLESKATRFQSLLDNLIRIWNLPTSSKEEEILPEAAKLPLMEDSHQELVDEVEKVVGTYQTDIARLEAVRALSEDKKRMSDEITNLQKKLAETKVPSGYKFLKSWNWGKLLFKLYKGGV